MYCNYQVNNCCKCRCKHFVESTSIKFEESLLEIEIPNRELCNKNVLCIKLAQPIPEGATSETAVVIVVDGVKYNTVNECSNFIYADQVKSGLTYSFRFGSDTTHFLYCGGYRLCRTRHNFNCIEPQAPEEAMVMKVSKPKTKKAEVKND